MRQKKKQYQFMKIHIKTKNKKIIKIKWMNKIVMHTCAMNRIEFAEVLNAMRLSFWIGIWKIKRECGIRNCEERLEWETRAAMRLWIQGRVLCSDLRLFFISFFECRAREREKEMDWTKRCVLSLCDTVTAKYG